MIELPRERQPDPALKQRVKSTLFARGLIRRRRTSRAWSVWVAAAAVVVLAVGISVFRPHRALIAGNTYVLFLDEDSTYDPPPPGHRGERRAELARWADSLEAVGKFERAGVLVGPGSTIGGMFIIRAASDSDAARIASTCPFIKHGGHVEVKRFEP